MLKLRLAKKFATNNSLDFHNISNDVNEDGTVDVLDYDMIVQVASGLAELTDNQKISADANGDEAVDSFDAIVVDLMNNQLV